MKKIKLFYGFQQILVTLICISFQVFLLFTALETNDGLIGLVCGMLMLAAGLFNRLLWNHYREEMIHSLKCHEVNNKNNYSNNEL